LYYIDLQICEKFGIDPYEWFNGEKWNNDEGLALKCLLRAYHQLNAEEAKRINDEMKNKSGRNE
jgi:hypothetical protein